MTLEEFNNHRFGANTIVNYDGRERDLFSVNMIESLIGLVEDCQGHDLGDIEWVRCENVTIVSE